MGPPAWGPQRHPRDLGPAPCTCEALPSWSVYQVGGLPGRRGGGLPGGRGGGLPGQRGGQRLDHQGPSPVPPPAPPQPSNGA